MTARLTTLTAALLLAGALGNPALAASRQNQPIGQQQAESRQQQPGDSIDQQRQSMRQALKAQGNFSTLLSMYDRAGMTDWLEKSGPYTLFAPTDKAFAGMDSAQRDSVLNNPEHLRKLLRYHMLPGLITSSQLDVIEHPQAMTGQLTIHRVGDHYTVNDADIGPQQIKTRNGVIHPVDQVLVPYYGNE